MSLKLSAFRAGKTNRVLVVGAFPPPMGGAAKTTRRVYDDLRMRDSETRAIDGSVGGAAHQKSIWYHGRRLLRFLGGLFVVAFYPRSDVCYMFCYAGYGMIYNLVQIAILRMRGTSLYIHHHSYAYIRRRSRMMSALLALSGSSTVHIFGDAAMRDAFTSAYGRTLKTRKISNAATMDVSREVLPPRRPDGGAGVTVGYLSNLCAEKGFDVVVETFEKLALRSAGFSFAIAGPAMTDADASLLTKAQVRLGSRLRYFGHVEGRAKLDFFNSIDVFVFPSRFQQEAQPNVVYEALAAGAVVVATRWAGIPAMLDGFPSILVDDQADLADTITEVVAELNAEGNWAVRRAQIVGRFDQVRRHAEDAYWTLIAEMLGASSGDATDAAGGTGSRNGDCRGRKVH